MSHGTSLAVFKMCSHITHPTSLTDLPHLSPHRASPYADDPCSLWVFLAVLPFGVLSSDFLTPALQTEAPGMPRSAWTVFCTCAVVPW